MLRCSWQNTLPTLETVAFEPGSDICSQAAAYRQSHPDLDMIESSPLSPEEALLEAAKLNAEKAISIAAHASAAASTQLAPTKAEQGKESQKLAEGSDGVPQRPPSAEYAVARPTPNDARAAIEEQLMSGAGYSPPRQAGSGAWPSNSDPFTANTQVGSALDPSWRAAAMPEGRKGPPKSEARALSLLGRKQTNRPGHRGGHSNFRMRPKQVGQCQHSSLPVCSYCCSSKSRFR